MGLQFSDCLNTFLLSFVVPYLRCPALHSKLKYVSVTDCSTIYEEVGKIPSRSWRATWRRLGKKRSAEL